ncbi:hypothetical protein BaRGS_00004668 [Batillaria attramentaria]|uniref:Uncharacterized protein n=1 Tax=Batillaria attramentaria TaxID=370345 RepID=A0ABD0LWN1_9CAEN
MLKLTADILSRIDCPEEDEVELLEQRTRQPMIKVQRKKLKPKNLFFFFTFLRNLPLRMKSMRPDEAESTRNSSLAVKELGNEDTVCGGEKKSFTLSVVEPEAGSSRPSSFALFALPTIWLYLLGVSSVGTNSLGE